MDPFRLCLALGPVAAYVLLLGAINWSRRPLLVSGTRDAAALGLAISGLAIIGPVELFFPEVAALHYGPYVWLFLLAFWALCMALVLLLLRPRLVIYNIAGDQLRPVLADVVDRLDADARWTGDILVLPKLGVQLHVDNLAAMRNVALGSVGANQSHAGWRKLESALGAALSRVQVARNPRGLSLMFAGALIATGLFWAIARDPQTVLDSLFEMLRLRA